MFVNVVSLRGRRGVLAVDIVEPAEALDSPGTGNVVFATLVDDPANVLDNIDAYLGEVMLEAASAADVIDAAIPMVFEIVETATADTTQDGVVTTAPAYNEWNPSDKSATVTLTGGLTVAPTTTVSCGIRSLRSATSGK